VEIDKTVFMKKTIKLFSTIILILITIVLITGCTEQASTTPQPGTNTSSGYRLNVSRLFGYSSGSQIKGSFRLKVIGVADIQSVEYRIDGNIIAVVNTDPFQLDFQTEKYPIGIHALSAWVTTKLGTVIEIPTRKFEFATAAQESKSFAGIILPLGGIVVLAVGLGLGLQFMVLRKRKYQFIPLGTSRRYGIKGGAICPKCDRPTVLHPFSFNIGFRQVYDFCENCGKWSVLKIRPEHELREAEENEKRATQDQSASPQSADDKLKEMLDNSKYSNS
jgi:hypothetical protein